MDSTEAKEVRRLHIGNISSQLHDKKEILVSRLEKFGTITKPISFHTKPLNEYYFAFVEIESTQKQFERLKNAFNGILFMGRKLSVGLARPNFDEEWKRRQTAAPKELSNHEKTAEQRQQRIKEAKTLYPANAVTGSFLLKTSIIGANNSSMGYHVSSHTFNNMSANTKNKSPTSDLIGFKSYGSTLVPKGPFSQQFSKTSGHGEVIRGRMRKTPRPTVYFVRKQQTMRILINGELKQFKCYKTKLWGLEKNKTVRDLTYSFHNNEWRSGDDHIVERVHKVRNVATEEPQSLKCGVDAVQASQYGATASHPEDFEAEDVHFAQEKAKNASVLAKLLSANVFDRPLELEEESEEEDVTYDSKGRKSAKRFDYEAEGVVDFGNDDDEEEAIPLEDANSLLQSLKADHAPTQEVYYDESDEGNELDMDALGQQLTTEAIKEKYDAEHGFEVAAAESKEEGAKNDKKDHINRGKESMETEMTEEPADDLEENLMPTFGQPNQTETLRSLFNLADQDSGFQLGLDDENEDIAEENLIDEEERQKLLEQIKSKQEQHQQEVSVTSKRKFGLFWSHFESPFLQTQAQLSKIGHVAEIVHLPGEEEGQEVRDEGHGAEDAYERWFWSMRGEIGRECKRRKRDVMRLLKKKKTQPMV